MEQRYILAQHNIPWDTHPDLIAEERAWLIARIQKDHEKQDGTVDKRPSS